MGSLIPVWLLYVINGLYVSMLLFFTIYFQKHKKGKILLWKVSLIACIFITFLFVVALICLHYQTPIIKKLSSR